MSALDRHHPELVDLAPPAREEPLEVAGPDADDVADALELMADGMATPSGRNLIDCPYCCGEGEIAYNPSRIGDPQCETSAPCPTCRGEGTVERRTWDIVVCVLCMEHVNDCRCDLDRWTGPEPPTMQLTVELDDLEAAA